MWPARYFSSALGPDSAHRRSTMRTEPGFCRASQGTSTTAGMSDMLLPPAPFRVLTPTQPAERSNMVGAACLPCEKRWGPSELRVVMSADGAQSGIERLLVVDDEGPI